MIATTSCVYTNECIECGLLHTSLDISLYPNLSRMLGVVPSCVYYNKKARMTLGHSELETLICSQARSLSPPRSMRKPVRCLGSLSTSRYSPKPACRTPMHGFCFGNCLVLRASWATTYFLTRQVSTQILATCT